jgi:hypothetical protein
VKTTESDELDPGESAPEDSGVKTTDEPGELGAGEAALLWALSIFLSLPLGLPPFSILGGRGGPIKAAGWGFSGA